jgi:ABC-type tungstate transport system permease subunit
MSGGAPSHDVVGAVEKIAAAGAQGQANFVSRGGTPGTTVEEHTIWGLTHGVTTCTVSTANGGGRSPSTTTGNCPDSISYPSWYHATGLSQGPNVENADVCNYSHGDCYVLTDRGTFQYLESTHAISHLKIVTRDNKASARGGNTLLINSFHAYAINPAKFAGDSNVHINLAGAEAFLNWVTSPAGQRDVGKFMAAGGDPPFLPDAAPALGVDKAPKKLTAGHKLVVTGTLRNKVPGTPSLAGVQVRLTATPDRGPTKVVDTTTTTRQGHFRLHVRPKRSASYSVSSASISQIEIPKPRLDPSFGDLLRPASASAGHNSVRGHVSLQQPTATGGVVKLAGSLAPVVAGKQARLKIFTQHANGHSDARAVRIRSRRLPAGAKHFRVRLHLKPGRRWIVSVRYSNPGVILAGDSKQRTIVV